MAGKENLFAIAAYGSAASHCENHNAFVRQYTVWPPRAPHPRRGPVPCGGILVVI